MWHSQRGPSCHPPLNPALCEHEARVWARDRVSIVCIDSEEMLPARRKEPKVRLLSGEAGELYPVPRKPRRKKVKTFLDMYLAGGALYFLFGP